MKYSITKPRSTISYIKYDGDFSIQNELQIYINWIINDKVVNVRSLNLPILDNKIEWVACESIGQEQRDYFDKVFKLIIFG